MPRRTIFWTSCILVLSGIFGVLFYLLFNQTESTYNLLHNCCIYDRYFFSVFISRSLYMEHFSIVFGLVLFLIGTSMSMSRQILFFIALFFYICLFVWVLRHINLCRLFNAKSIFIQMHNSISNNSAEHKYTV